MREATRQEQLAWSVAQQARLLYLGGWLAGWVAAGGNRDATGLVRRARADYETG